MKRNKTFKKDAVFACEVSSSVLGSIESLMVHARKQTEKETEDEKTRELLEDLQSVEDWFFTALFSRKPSRFFKMIETTVSFGVVVLAFIGFRAIT